MSFSALVLKYDYKFLSVWLSVSGVTQSKFLEVCKEYFCTSTGFRGLEEFH